MLIKTLTKAFLAQACIILSAVWLTGCDNGGRHAAAPPKVFFTTLEAGPVTLAADLPGRVIPYAISEVRPQVGGIIQKRLFEEGSYVVEGQLLYQIDPALFMAALNNAKASLAKAEANENALRLMAERHGKLVAVHAVSRQEYDDAIAAHRQAQADVQAAREALTTADINLGYTRVTAPVSGRVGRSFVTQGALVTQNQAEPLATVQQIDTVYVDISQASSDQLRLRRAFGNGRLGTRGTDTATVRLRLEDGSVYSALGPDGETAPIEGELLFSEAAVEKGTGAVTLRALFPNPDGVLLPGMHVRAELSEGTLDSALLVPQKSVQRDSQGRPYVFILHEAEHGGVYSVELRHIDITRAMGNTWLVGSGIEAGEHLLTEGHLKARPGSLVSGVDADVDSTYSASLPHSRQAR